MRRSALSQPQDRPTLQRMRDDLETGLQEMRAAAAAPSPQPSPSSVAPPVAAAPPAVAPAAAARGPAAPGGKEAAKPRGFWSRVFCLPPSK